MSQQISLDFGGVHDSLGFAQCLHSAGVLGPADTGIRRDYAQKDLRKSWTLSLEDLSILLLVARGAAESGSNVTILGPSGDRGKSPDRRALLYKSGFYQAVSDHVTLGPWVKRISFPNPDANSLPRAQGDLAAANYIPFTWLSEASFIHESNWWLDRPRLRTDTASQLRERLTAGGYLNGEGIQTLINTIFLEVGWNIVLHSQEREGSGIGIFVAQILNAYDGGRRRSTLSFSLTDVGCGIPRTLRDTYLQKAPDAITLAAGTEASRIIRFAVSPNGTRRTLMSSRSDAGSSLTLAVRACDASKKKDAH